MNKLTFVFALSVFLSACKAGSGEGLDENGLPGSAGDSESPANQGVTLADLNSEIFGAICIECHIGAGAPQGLRLDSEQNAFDFLVNVAANQMPWLLRVEPGNPDDSYVVHKVEGGPNIVGGRMPLGRTPLTTTQISMLRDWISNGAPRNGDGMSATVVEVVSMKNTPATTEFALHFSRPIDQSTVDALSMIIELQSANETQLLSSNDYSLSWRSAQDLKLQLPLPDAEFEQYRIRLNNPAVAAIYDQRGRLLDGDSDLIDGGEFDYVHKL